MSLIHRFLLLLSSFLLFIVVLLLASNYVGQVFFDSPYIFNKLEKFLKSMSWWNLFIIVVYAIPAYKLLRYSFRRRLEEKRIIYSTKLGEVRVAVEAVESLIVRAARRIKGVKEVEAWVKIKNDQIHINVEVAVLPDLHLPEITAEVRQRVREYMTETLGITIKDENIEVNVDKIAFENRGKIEWTT